MSAFGYDYFTDHYGAERESDNPTLAVIRDCAEQVASMLTKFLNLVNGRRTAQEIRDAVSAAYGPIPVGASGGVSARSGVHPCYRSSKVIVITYCAFT